MSAETALRERLLAALSANSYRGAWNSDRDTMMPMRWDEDDAVDRIIEDAALASPESRSLDVETLAHAIRIWTRRLDRGLIEGDAESVAAEYDRLREHPEGDPR